MSGKYENVAYAVADGVLRVTLQRPDKRNALSRQTLRELADIYSRHDSDETVKVAVLSGAGDKAFAAGGDLQEFGAIRTRQEAEDLWRLANECLDAVRYFPVPTVAALNGAALGGGAELAAACDFRVAAPHASIGYVHSRLAITSGFGGATDLQHVLGAGPAFLHVLRGEALTAVDAHVAGLVDALADSGESLDQCVLRFVEPMLRLKPQVLRGLKAPFKERRLALRSAKCLDAERNAFAGTWAHEDHWIALDRVFTRKK